MSIQIIYSVIIPFRNDLHLLKNALNSIPDREDIQILIVDNSKHSLESQFVNEHRLCSVMYLISDSSKGAGCARNVGLRHAVGQWLLFLDADDYFMPHAFNLFDEYKDSKCELIYFNITSCMLETGEASKRHLPYNRKINEYLISHNESIVRYTFPTPYCKMICRSLVENNGIVFDETRVSNDLMFSMRCGHFACKIIADKRIAYCVTEANKDGSLMKQHNPDNWEIRYKVAIEKYKMMREIGHLEAAPSLYGYVVVAFKDFGCRKFWHFIQLGMKEKVNFFIKFTKKGWINDH